MNIPTIQISQTPARIQTSSTPGRLQVEQSPATLQLNQPRPEIRIDVQKGQLSIDQTAAWNAMNVKHIFTRISETANKGQQKALEGTARRAREGRELAAIENGGNPIVQQAKRNTERNIDTQIGWLPGPQSVRFSYQPAKVNVDMQATPMIRNNSHANPTRVTYTPGDVSTQLVQKPSIAFQAVNKTI